MNNPYTLTEQQQANWQAHGYCVVRDLLDEPSRQLLLTWADEMSAWPEQPGQWMKYFEKTDSNERQLCRVEHFIEYHSGWADLINGPAVRSILNQLFGEPAQLFKEKLNYKLPGGGGFLPHQDAPAFTQFGQDFHITMMVAVDPSTLENGCLHVQPGGYHKQGVLPQTAGGALDAAVYANYEWLPVPCNTGDLIFFDSYIPHFSKKNNSTQPRRAAYVTFNPESAGDKRAQYYRDKREKFPPECERDPNVDYTRFKHVYNLANPIE